MRINRTSWATISALIICALISSFRMTADKYQVVACAVMSIAKIVNRCEKATKWEAMAASEAVPTLAPTYCSSVGRLN